MSVNTGWSVGKVAERCGVKVSTLHFYEEKGLISSWRNQGNQRRYQKDVLRRVSVIKAAQKVGIKLEDIKLALSALPETAPPIRKTGKCLPVTGARILMQELPTLQN